MPSEPQPTEAASIPSTEPANDATGTVVQYPAAAGAQPPPMADKTPPPACALGVGDHDERGNTVKYIYACDQDYVVYYSRLERVAGETDEPMPLRHRLRRLLRPQRLRSQPVFDAAYESEGVQAQLSPDPVKRQLQRRLLLPLGNERAKLQALLSRWQRRCSYDTRIATALQLALDGDSDGTSAKRALETLTDAKAAILAERDIAGRAQYVKYTVLWGLFGLVAIAPLQHGLFYGDATFCLGIQAGLVGAILSIAVSIRRRQVALNIDAAANMTDSLLRLLIGAVSGGTLVLLFATGLLPALSTATGNLSIAKSPHAQEFAVLLGLIAGFVEQLVPSMLEKEADRFTAGDLPGTPAAGADTGAKA